MKLCKLLTCICPEHQAQSPINRPGESQSHVELLPTTPDEQAQGECNVGDIFEISLYHIGQRELGHKGYIACLPW